MNYTNQEFQKYLETAKAEIAKGFSDPQISGQYYDVFKFWSNQGISSENCFFWNDSYQKLFDQNLFDNILNVSISFGFVLPRPSDDLMMLRLTVGVNCCEIVENFKSICLRNSANDSGKSVEIRNWMNQKISGMSDDIKFNLFKNISFGKFSPWMGGGISSQFWDGFLSFDIVGRSLDEFRDFNKYTQIINLLINERFDLLNCNEWIKLYYKAFHR